MFATECTRQCVILPCLTGCELLLTALQSDPRSFIVRKTADEVFKVYVAMVYLIEIGTSIEVLGFL